MACPNCKIFHKKCKAECCGPVPINRQVFNLNFDKIQVPLLGLKDLDDEDVLPMTESLNCVFLTDKQECAIYDDRPEVCRLFGDESDINLTCKWQTAAGQARPKFQRKKIEQEQIIKTQQFLNQYK